MGNGSNGVEVSRIANTTIGGTTATARNLISGNANDGIKSESSTSTIVQGNFIGTDVTGTHAVGNLSNNGGLELQGDTNDIIGGTTSAARNLISGNRGNGITLSNLGSNILIEGNYIGTDITGTMALGNFFGLQMDFQANTMIGGASSGAGNLISGNRATAIGSAFGQGTVVQGNIIGTDVTGTQALGNGGSLFIQSEDRDLIGGAQAGAGNLISANQGDGISLERVTGLVQGNTIGTDITGTRPLGNSGNGIALLQVNGFSGLTIGGTTAAARNLISGNQGDGVFITQNSAHDLVEGNYIGTDASGTVALGNVGNGIQVFSAFITIGGTATGAGNVISGNGQDGILFPAVQNQGSELNTVQGNRIGTDATGTFALGNGGDGVGIFDGSLESIGGTTPAAANVISANAGSGVVISGGFMASFNHIVGNLIGTDASGTLALGNAANGVTIDGFNNNIGGAGAGNVIAFNALDGVLVNSGNANLISQNSIFSNGGLGIDLNAANNANHSQVAPVLTIAVSTKGRIVVTGSLTSTPNTTFTIEFFASSQSATSGQILIGSITVTTSKRGQAHFRANFAFAVPRGDFITATATDPNTDKSKFSNSQVVMGP
jgi:titin